MTSTQFTEEAVLEAFMLEEPGQAGVLERYLKRYPDHAAALIDLAHGLALPDPVHGDAITGEEGVWIDAAWNRLDAATGAGVVSTQDWTRIVLKAICDKLGLPMLVVTAFRDRKISPSTVPADIIGQIAATLNRDIAALADYLSQPPVLPRAAAYKAVVQPKTTDAKMSFEQALEDAGVSEADRRKLLGGPV